VLVNQGTIPGEYRKEGTRQLKETKKLFEGLLQGSAEGAESHTTRHFPSSTSGSVSF
jgi:ATP-dependent phosphoenolpyruvate carboxykinase